VTTNVKAVEAVYKYCKKNSKAEVIIGKGCGSGVTADAFRKNGYNKLSEKYNFNILLKIA